jgi:hypothetical protein
MPYSGRNIAAQWLMLLPVSSTQSGGEKIFHLRIVTTVFFHISYSCGAISFIIAANLLFTYLIKSILRHHRIFLWSLISLMYFGLYVSFYTKFSHHNVFCVFFSFIYPIESLKCNLKDLSTVLYVPIVPGTIRRVQLMLLHPYTYLFSLHPDPLMAKSMFFLPKCDYFQSIRCRELPDLWAYLVDWGRGTNA